VTFEFGPFRLDEAGRVLRLEGRELPLQPRAFDLLVYLVRNRERVVSKDELLDMLWPGVTVTDNSLQRAISTLRGVLREGGMEEAVRNFPKSGYRFCFDAATSEDGEAGTRGGGDFGVARQAIAEQRWSEAAALFGECDATDELSAEDLDRWALALQCLGKPSDAIPILVRSAALHTQADRRDLAAECAVSLSTIHLERGEPALAKGWLSRAQDLVATHPDSLAAGLLLWMSGRVASFEGDLQGALELAGKAYDFGRKIGDFRIESLGLMYRGFFRLSLGETRAGLADQDHAAALALSNKLDPITGGVLYCNILWACRSFGDWARAAQWTVGYQQFCTTSRVGFSGSCQLHRAEVLGLQGSLLDALAHVNDALARLSDDAPWALGDAHRVFGDIQAAIGNADAAFAAYEKSYTLGWSPEPGRAMLLVERGEVESAYASLERSLIGQGWWMLQRQGMLLAHLALVAALSGRNEKAKALIADLAGQEERWPLPSIRALTNEASAILARDRGEPDEALRHLHLARQLWTSVDSRLNATRLRLQIADLQLDLGDTTGAATEIRTASIVADELKSKKLMRQCKSIQDRLENDARGMAGRS
jgi:DNA-binding winged helix-turn-helix (wHTH) protein/tetratricopeptide (TPR) repeat protein